MFGMLCKIFSRHTVTRKLRIARKGLVFLDNLLRRATHLAFWTGGIEHAVDDIAKIVAAIIILVARARLVGRSHVLVHCLVGGIGGHLPSPGEFSGPIFG